MDSRRTLIITAPRGSGGSYTHLSRVLPRLMDRMRGWRFELHAPADVLLACFAGDGEPWMHPLPGGSYWQRVRWEFLELPRRLRSDPGARVWSPFGPPLNLRLSGRTAWMSRNVIPLLPTREWELSRPDHLRLRIMRHAVLAWAQSAAQTMSVSKHARDRLAAMAAIPPSRIAVVPHGIDAVGTSAKSSADALEHLRTTRYVLHVGQPVAYRRTRELIQGYSLLCERRPDVPPLVLVGKARGADAAYERECLGLVEPLVRERKATVLGQLKHADAVALMATAHAFAYPSVHENCPNIVLEALAASRVGVYADIEAVRELADDAAIYVPDALPSDIAEALERAIFDGDLRTRVAKKAAQRAALFTWDATADLTAEVLEKAFTVTSGA